MRIRDLGYGPGILPTGPNNAITDVPGVRVGQATIADGVRFATGVTAIVPPRVPVPAGLFVGNGYGKLIGATQLAELGEIETPILLTGTLSAFRVADAFVTWLLERPGNEAMRSVNPVVGETNDGLLSDIRARPIAPDDVFAALDGAAGGPVAEGCVGAGTGTTALGFKAGIGTASRVLGGQAIGVLAQANFGGVLTVDGARIPAPNHLDPPGNSCMIVVATDAPMTSRQLERIARRAVFAMARVGANYGHGSGDYGIAFSTGRGRAIPDTAIDAWFAAVQDATEEALLNSLTAARTTTGAGGVTIPAVDHHAIRAALARR
jgi:D-aminopeptidase